MRLVIAALAAASTAPSLALGTPPAHADTVAYLVNVTMRPGYHFADAADALAYGYGICDAVRQRVSYPQAVGTVMTDFSTDDDYQAAYLINQAVNELCPELIWQLRNSAAGYTSPSRLGGAAG